MHAAIETTVRPTSHSEKPYSPTWYETCRSLIQGAFCENWSPVALKSNRTACSIQTPTSTSDTSTARLPIAYRERGRIHSAIAAPTGSQMRTEVKSETLI